MSARMQPSDFEIVRKLGEGAYSKVYLERRIQDGAPFAVKVLRRMHEDDSDENLMRIIAATNREMRILLMCNHPHIVSFLAAMQDNDERMYVMEYCEGGDLTSILRRKGTIPLPAARHIAAEISSALLYLHEGEKKTIPIVPDAPLRRHVIIHRDIKPDNVMLTKTRHVKLIDFGSASSPLDTEAGAEPQQAKASTFVGTMHYMSPELVKESFTTPASDYWAMGVVLFEMLTGSRPFDGPAYPLMDSIVNDAPVFPADFDPVAKDFILQLMHKNHEERLQGIAVRSHPFFASITNWSDLQSTDTSALWVRNATWTPNDRAPSCGKCGKGFMPLVRPRHHCRNCGGCFCGDCSSHFSVIPDSTYKAAERVCDPCFDKLS